MISWKLFQLLLWIEFGSAILVFFVLFFVNAPYGRFNRKGWGPVIHSRAAWIIMELPAVLVILLMYLLAIPLPDSMSMLFLIIWEIHYFYRTFIYPLRMRGANKPFPVLLVLMAFVFNIINGYINGYALFSMKYPVHTHLNWLKDPRFILGVMLFFSGLAIHIRSDAILRELRENHRNTYQIPQGGFFRYVSCPNYLGEIIEWMGWALLTWSWPGLAFALFTIANLVPRAFSHHRWYREYFPDYPGKRRALIPFLL
jgi:3-oxo-5-alpha-steroid 4-dehydrogenase 1